MVTDKSSTTSGPRCVARDRRAGPLALPDGTGSVRSAILLGRRVRGGYRAVEIQVRTDKRASQLHGWPARGK